MSSTVTSCPLEKSLCCPKPKKCCKVVKCETECDPIDCCPTVPEIDPCACEQPMDCCSLPYQRLDKLRTIYATIASSALAYEHYDSAVTVAQVITSGSEVNEVQTFNRTFTRDGNPVTVPQASLFTSTAPVPSNIVGFFPVNGGAVGDQVSAHPDVGNVTHANAAAAFNFVQTMRYVMYRDVVCTAADQVIGWFVNPAGRQLQVFQDLTGVFSALGLTYTDSLQYYDSLTTMTSQQKQKLASLNILFDLSVDAVRRVNLNPKTEGNMLVLCDRCGQKWMLVINTADTPSSTTFRAGANGYVIVACRL